MHTPTAALGLHVACGVSLGQKGRREDLGRGSCCRGGWGFGAVMDFLGGWLEAGPGRSAATLP